MTDLRERLVQFKKDRAFFSISCLEIRDKAGRIVPLTYNEVQKLVDQKLDEQKAQFGWVRAIILKARQPGISTYVASRYYHKTSLFTGVSTYILTHEQPASDNLFNIVERFQRKNPIAPHVGTANVKELEFDKLESSYVVATAGQKAGGRGRSITLFHGSEVAFWPNASDHFAASVQAVPLIPGTEIILESTANGPAGEFYERCQDAESGRGDYILIFIPWYMTAEYYREPPPGFELSSEGTSEQLSEVEIAQMYELSDGQMYWRRQKIVELRSIEKFNQEYPADSSEAFVAAGADSYISPVLVAKARKRKTEGSGPLIIGVDPASSGGDRFAITARRGMRVEWVKHREKLDHLTALAWVKSIIDEFDPARVNIDAGNIGGPLITSLKAAGPKYAEKVRAVNFGGTSQAKMAKPKKPGPRNRRAEMYMRALEWLGLPEGAALPDIPALQSDLTAVRQEPQLNGDFMLETKKKMKTRGVRSPDLGDSFVLTFAFVEYIERYSEPTAGRSYGNTEQDKPQARPVSTPPLGGRHGWMS